MTRRWLLATALTAVVALGVGRLLPASGFGLWLRLASATTLVLLPGAFVAASLELPLGSGALVATLAFVGVGLAVTFAVHGTLWLAIGVAAALAAASCLVAARLGGDRRLPAAARIAPVGLALGATLWPLAPALAGDALFHVARMRKLLAFGSLSLHRVDEFRDGGLHPGYAFPLWHGLLAIVARVADVDPALVVRREPTVLVAIAFAVAFEAGLAVFGTAAGGTAVLVAQVGLYALAPGHGGAYTSLALPATAARQLLVPSVLAAFFHRGRPRAAYALALLAAAELALVHVTYALFTAIVLVGFLGVRALQLRRGSLGDAARVAAVLVGAGAVVGWLEPIAAAARSHNPACTEVRRAFANYPGQLIHSSCTHYRLAPSMVTRSGAIAIAALLLVPLAAVAARRAWAALVLGGTVVILVLVLLPWTFPHFADVVSISQARRAAGFVPVPFALAGGVAVLARVGRLATPVAALVAGVALELAYPGWFDSSAPSGAPGYPAWVALAGGAAAVAAGWLFRSRLRDVSVGGVAVAAVVLLVLPAAVEGASDWSTAGGAAPAPLSRGLLAELARPPLRGTIVYSDPSTSYALAAYAPVYIATAPPSHVANTPANDPYRRWNDAAAFLRTGSLAIPRGYHACTILLRRPARIRPRLPVLYRDRGLVLYALEPRCS